jgi:hypothetical protein
MMCIFTAGLAIVHPDQLSAAGAINNVVQRVMSALALALVVAMETNTHAQLYANRRALIPPDAYAHAQTPLGLGLEWTRLQVQVTNSTYGNVFVLTAIVAAVDAIAALWLRIPPASHGPAPS